MTYKEVINKCCREYAKIPKTLFIGYNTRFGSKIYGTLEGINDSQLLEFPVQENMMVSMAIGLALEGWKPVVCFERHDFMLLGLDAMVNHLDKLSHLSNGDIKLDIKIRAIVGGSMPLYAGVQHTQDYTREIRSMLRHTDVFIPNTAEEFELIYSAPSSFKDSNSSGAVVIVEYKDKYNLECAKTSNEI